MKYAKEGTHNMKNAKEDKYLMKYTKTIDII